MTQHPLRQMASVCLLHARLFTLEAHIWLTVVCSLGSAAADVYGSPHAIVVGAACALACFTTLISRLYLEHETIVALRPQTVRRIDQTCNAEHDTQPVLAFCTTPNEGLRTAVVARCRTVQP